MSTPAILAKRDQQQAQRLDDLAAVAHQAHLTTKRYKALRGGGMTSQQAFTLTRDWHCATFCDGLTSDEDD